MARNHVNSLPLVQVYWYDFICERRDPNATAEKHVNENIVRYGSSRRLTKGRAGCLHRSGKRGRGALPCVEHRCKVPRVEDGEDGSDFSLYLHPLADKRCAGRGIGDEITEQTQSLPSRNILLMSIRWTIAASVSSACRYGGGLSNASSWPTPQVT